MSSTASLRQRRPSITGVGGATPTDWEAGEEERCAQGTAVGLQQLWAIISHEIQSSTASGRKGKCSSCCTRVRVSQVRNGSRTMIEESSWHISSNSTVAVYDKKG